MSGSLSAARFLASLAADRTALIVGATRAAADELAFTVASERGGVFGITRASFAELVTKLALPALARESLSPTGGLGAEAIAARAAFEALQAGRLTYFAPVAHLPGFPRALSRTLSEVRLAGLAAADVAHVAQAGGDLAELLVRTEGESRNAGTVDRAALLDAATDALAADSAAIPHVAHRAARCHDREPKPIDVSFVRSAPIDRSSRPSPTATSPRSPPLIDLGFHREALPRPTVPRRRRPPRVRCSPPCRMTTRRWCDLQRHLFSNESVPAGHARRVGRAVFRAG